MKNQLHVKLDGLFGEHSWYALDDVLGKEFHLEIFGLDIGIWIGEVVTKNYTIWIHINVEGQEKLREPIDDFLDRIKVNTDGQ